MSELNRARDALFAISPDIERDEWARVAMAANDAGLSFADFDKWSSGGESYKSQDARTTWKSCAKEGGIKAGTLYAIAKDHGWKNPRKREPNARNDNADALNLWKQCEPAPALHPYIVLKQGMPDGLRVVPENHTLSIMGESMAGALVVPCKRPDGTLSTLQFIPPPDVAKRLKDAGKPGKLNLRGCSLDGWFTVGDMAQGKPVHLVEGIGQAWAVHRATGAPAVVCFGWGRVQKVAQQLRESDRSAALVLVPDRGKEESAAKIAQEVRAAVAQLPQDKPDNYDANDYASHEGIETLKALLDSVEIPGPRFKLLTAADLRAMPTLTWRIKDILPGEGVAALYGPASSGKSFLALDMAAAIAEGREWFGCRVEAAPVVYVALEGEGGFRNRVAAWEARQARPLPDAMGMILQPFALTTGQERPPQDIADLAAVVSKGAVVFIDTLNRAAPLADENSSRDMGAILQGAKNLQAETGGLVVLIHHTGKNAAAGLRGHSSLFAAMDAAVEVARDGDRRSWRTAKAKDGRDDISQAFKLDVVELGRDEYGDPITSCVVEPDETPADEVSRVKLPQGGNQRLVFDALRSILAKQSPCDDNYPPFVPAGQVAVELEAVLPELAGSLTCASDKRTSRARDAVTGLINRGIYGFKEGWLWRQ